MSCVHLHTDLSICWLSFCTTVKHFWEREKKRAKLEPTEPDQEQYASILIFGGD
jgi:hypothetical protein